jgi:hypothetical protein
MRTLNGACKASLARRAFAVLGFVASRPATAASLYLIADLGLGIAENINDSAQVVGGYLMFLDADDLVHRELVSYVLSQQHPHGYLLKYGYELNARTNTVRRVKNFDQICGSCAVLRFEPDDLPLTQDKSQDIYFNQFRNHKLWSRVAADHNRPLAEIPFEAAMYVRNTGENYTEQLSKPSLKQKLLSLFSDISVDERIRKDFALPA